MLEWRSSFPLCASSLRLVRSKTALHRTFVRDDVVREPGLYIRHTYDAYLLLSQQERALNGLPYLYCCCGKRVTHWAGWLWKCCGRPVLKRSTMFALPSGAKCVSHDA